MVRYGECEYLRLGRREGSGMPCDEVRCREVRCCEMSHNKMPGSEMQTLHCIIRQIHEPKRIRFFVDKSLFN
jgi:hypothetical protein